MDSQDDTLLADAAEQLLAGQCTPAMVRRIEGGGDTAALWQAIEDSGFADALVPEAMGGAGLGLRDVGAVLEACGRHALPLPLAQTMLVRGLLAQAGHAPPPGPIALALAGGAAAGSAPGLWVADGAVADWVLVGEAAGAGAGKSIDESAGVIAGTRARLLNARLAERLPAGDGSLDAQLHWPATALAEPWCSIDAPGTDLLALQAAVLALQMAGALRRVFDMSLRHANDRTQFGRSIGKFQAIQHQLAVMAEHTAAATMAARMACTGAGLAADPLACAVAKARCSEAVVPVTSIAHAVHGAIGITAEYDLQLFTRRLQAWRVTAGSESFWHARIGRALLASPHASLAEFARVDLCPATPEPVHA